MARKPTKRGGVTFASSIVTFDDVSDIEGLLFEASPTNYDRSAQRKHWRVLIVVDKPMVFEDPRGWRRDASEDADDSEEAARKAMPHDSAVTLGAMIGHTITSIHKGKRELLPAGKIQVLCAALPDGPKMEKLDTRGRLIALCRSVEPDVVMLASSGVAYAVAQPPPKKMLVREYGRLKDYDVDSFARGRATKRMILRAIVTMPLEQLVDTNPPIRGAEGGGAVNLISHFCEHLEAALLNRNRHELSRAIGRRFNAGYTNVDTLNKFKTFMAALRKCAKPAIDSEGASLGHKVNTLLCLQFYLPTQDGKGGRGYFLPMRHRESKWTAKEYAYIKRTLKDYFETGRSTYIVMHNGKFDIQQLYGQLGVRWFGHRLYDTIAGAQVLDESRKQLPRNYIAKPYGLDTLECNYGYVRSGLAVDKEDRSNMADKPLAEIEPYGVLDAITTYCIHRAQLADAKRAKHGKFAQLVVDQVGNTMRAIARMEFQGMRMDVGYLTSMTLKDSPINKIIAEQAEMFKASKAAQRVNLAMAKKAGWQPTGLYGKVQVPWVFNLRKDEHKRALFLDQLKLAPVDFSKKTGEPSLGKAFIAEYKGSVDEVGWLNAYSEAYKLKTGFIDSLLETLLSDADAILDQHIRSSYSTRAVESGRLSSQSPNLQNIPTRSKISGYIKRAFTADFNDGVQYVTLKADMSAHEINMAGNVANDTAVIETFEVARAAKLALRLATGEEAIKAAKDNFARNGDLHIISVKRMYGLDIDKSHPLRTAIKAVIFGLLYAKGPPALGKDITSEELKKLKAQQHAIDREMIAIEEELGRK